MAEFDFIKRRPEDGEKDLAAAYRAYRATGAGLSFTEWFSAGQPTSPTSGPTVVPDPEAEGDTQEFDIIPEQGKYALDYQKYWAAGGRLSNRDWLAAGRPVYTGNGGADGGNGVPVNGNGGADGGNGVPVIVDDDDDEDDFSAELAAAVEAMKQQIREMGEFERAEAQRLSARGIGKMSRMTQQALLAQGRTAGEIEQLTAGGMEAGQRSLNDLLQALSLGEKRALVGAEQFGIGTMISGEELGIRERQMSQEMARYQQSFEEQRRQFGVGAGQWQQQFGLSQQQLAQQAQQFGQQYGLAQREQQYAQAWWQPLVQVLGGISQGAGAGIGAYLGTRG